MYRSIKRFETMVRHPYVDFIFGLIIIVLGLMDAADTFWKDILSGNLGANHAIMLLGLAHAVKALPSALATLMLFFEAEIKHSDRE